MSAPSCYTSENIATAGATPNRNGAPEALANLLPADLVERHCSHAEARRRARNVSLACRRCDQPFEIIQRGIRLTKWPTICPECKRQAKAASAKRRSYILDREGVAP
jgi:hypothetical protein